MIYIDHSLTSYPALSLLTLPMYNPRDSIVRYTVVCFISKTRTRLYPLTPFHLGVLFIDRTIEIWK